MTELERRQAVRVLLDGFSAWSIGDDYERGEAVESSDPADLRRLVVAVDELPDSAWEWLAGPEAR